MTRFLGILVGLMLLACGGGGTTSSEIAEIPAPPRPAEAPAEPLPVRTGSVPEATVRRSAGDVPEATGCDSVATEAFCTALVEGDGSVEAVAGPARGVDMNCTCAVEHSRKKLGAYIPIVKDTMKEHHKRWTAQETPLYVAVSRRHEPLMRWLVEQGAHPDMSNGDGTVPLTRALQDRRRSVVDWLVEQGADVALADLGRCRDVDLVVEMMEQGGDASTIDVSFVLRQRDREGLERLLAYDPPLDDVNPADIGDDRDTLILLLDHGLSLDTRDTFGEPLLHHAAEDGDDELVEILLERGVPPDQRCTDSSAVAHAVDAEDEDLARQLAARGATVDVKNTFGKTGLYTSVSRGHTRQVEIWLELGADPNTTSRVGDHVLQEAIERDDLGIIMMLVEAGADFESDGLNPWEYAKQEGASGPTLTYLESTFG